MHACIHALSILLDLLTKDGIAEWIDKARQGTARLLVYPETFSTCSVPVDHFYTQEIFSKTHSCMHGKLKRACLGGFFVGDGSRRT